MSETTKIRRWNILGADQLDPAKDGEWVEWKDAEYAVREAESWSRALEDRCNVNREYVATIEAKLAAVNGDATRFDEALAAKDAEIARLKSRPTGEHREWAVTRVTPNRNYITAGQAHVPVDDVGAFMAYEHNAAIREIAALKAQVDRMAGMVLDEQRTSTKLRDEAFALKEQVGALRALWLYMDACSENVSSDVNAAAKQMRQLEDAARSCGALPKEGD